MRIAVLTLVAFTACGGPKPASVPEPHVAPQVAPAAATSKSVPPAAPVVEAAAPVAPKPTAPTCVAKPNPAGCPDSEPNINAWCKKNGAECTYGPSCCPPLYVCSKNRFEARFQSCP